MYVRECVCARPEKKMPRPFIVILNIYFEQTFLSLKRKSLVAILGALRYLHYEQFLELTDSEDITNVT